MTYSSLFRIGFSGWLLSSLLVVDVAARIKLITLPVRERVEIQLNHPGVTLVEEERIVPLLAGENQVDFAWANTSIDAESIVFRVLEPSDDSVRVLSVSYPPNESALIWQVASAKAGSARVRISYLIGQLNKNFAYRALTSADEKTLQFSTDMKINNHANEVFRQASVWPGFGEPRQTDIEINESKQLRLSTFEQIPVKKTYTASVHEQGYLNAAQNKLRIPMHYELHNTKAKGLGEFALPAGKVRIFQQDKQGSSVFIGEDWSQFTPLDDKLKLYLGVAQDIVVKRHIAKSEQQRMMGNLYNHKVVIKYEIENFKTDAVTLDISENLRQLRDELRGYSKRAVEWEVLSETTLPQPFDKAESSFEKLVFHLPLAPSKKSAKTNKHTYYLALLFKNEWH